MICPSCMKCMDGVKEGLKVNAAQHTPKQLASPTIAAAQEEVPEGPQKVRQPKWTGASVGGTRLHNYAKMRREERPAKERVKATCLQVPKEWMGPAGRALPVPWGSTVSK